MVSEKRAVVVNGVTYLRFETIGKGGSGRVYKVLGPDMCLYALKQVRLTRAESESVQQYANEIELLNAMRGKPGIVQLLDSEIDTRGKMVQMVMELGEGDLNSLIKREARADGTIDETLIRWLWQQMLCAVRTIHQARIIHGDLKPANFVLVRGSLKLIDFGIAKAISGNTTNIYRESQVGTLNYMSPEAISGSAQRAGTMRIGKPSDVWSLGCILYQMAYGKTPFADLPIWQKLQAIIDDKYEITFPALRDPALASLLRACLSRKPEQRPTIDGPSGMLSHAFLLPTSLVGRDAGTTVTSKSSTALASKSTDVAKPADTNPVRQRSVAATGRSEPVDETPRPHIGQVMSQVL
jgi:serine/threonine-protein kinase TTK/MPS1